MWRLLIILMAGLCLGFAPAPAAANHDGDHVELRPCLKPALTTETPRQIAMMPAENFDCTDNQGRFAPGDYWVRMDDIPAAGHPGDELQFRMANTWSEILELYFVYADDHIVPVVLGQKEISRAVQPGDIIGVDIERRSVPLAKVVARVNGAANLRGILLSPHIRSQSNIAETNLLLIGFYAGIAGMCLALLVYNVALLWAMRQSFQVAYCGMLCFTLFYAFVSSGTYSIVSEDLENTYRIRLSYLAIGFLVSCATMFLHRFIEREKIPAYLANLLLFSSGYAAVASLLFFFFGPVQSRIFDQMFIGAILLSVLVAPIFFYEAIRRRSRYAGILMIAWLGPMGSAACRALNGFGLFPPSFLLDNSTLVGMSFEAIITSIAIGYRVRIMALERDRAMQREQLAQMHADTDPLTGLLNRRAFLRRALGSNNQWRLLIVDIDHFKRVNDLHGHDGGDEVLIDFAHLLRAHCPPAGMVARLGGEEFAILVPIGDGRTLREEDLLNAIRLTPMANAIRVTASVGIAEGGLRREEDWKRLYNAADAALYRAKDAGRDRSISDVPLGQAA